MLSRWRPSCTCVRQSCSIDVGGQLAATDLLRHRVPGSRIRRAFVVPIEVVAGVFFVLIALMFVGLGQEMGRAFDAIPNRVAAYTANILGSLTGIVVFGLMSYFRMPPVLWFALIAVLIFRFPRAARSGSRSSRPCARGWAWSLIAMSRRHADDHDLVALLQDPLRPPQTGDLMTNNIGHQGMVSVGDRGPLTCCPTCSTATRGPPVRRAS